MITHIVYGCSLPETPYKYHGRKIHVHTDHNLGTNLPIPTIPCETQAIDQTSPAHHVPCSFTQTFLSATHSFDVSLHLSTQRSVTEFIDSRCLCPIHLQHLLLFPSTARSWIAPGHIRLLLLVSGRQIQSMLHRQVL